MENLRTPGPIPMPPEVLQAMCQQMINHRGPKFAEILRRTTANLKILFQTNNDVIILTGSGTGGLETAVVNTMSPGDKVLSVSAGSFAERFASIATTFGVEVIPVYFDWGKAADPEVVRQALKDNPAVKSVLITHNETSTGLTCDLKSLAAVCKEFGKLVIVDAVSSLGSINLPIDEWQCDVVVTGSQKGWMSAPGVSMISMSAAAWKANAEAKIPRFYWDLAKAKSYMEKGQTSWTPVIPVIYGLDVATQIMVKEGLDSIFARHAHIATMVRDGVKKLGLPLFADEKYLSNTVTAVKAPEGLNVAKMRRLLLEQHQVVVAGGQRKLSGKIFRIGHLGKVSEKEINEVMAALQQVLPQAGFNGVK